MHGIRIATSLETSNRETAFHILRWLLPEIDDPAVKQMIELSILMLARDD